MKTSIFTKHKILLSNCLFVKTYVFLIFLINLGVCHLFVYHFCKNVSLIVNISTFFVRCIGKFKLVDSLNPFHFTMLISLSIIFMQFLWCIFFLWLFFPLVNKFQNLQYCYGISGVGIFSFVSLSLKLLFCAIAVNLSRYFCLDKGRT